MRLWHCITSAMDTDELQVILLIIAQFLVFFSALQPSLRSTSIPLNQRLLPGFRGSGFNGRDVFSLIAGQPWLFWRNTEGKQHNRFYN